MGDDFLGVAGPDPVPIRPPSPLEGDSEGFKANRTLFFRSQKLTVEHIRDGSAWIVHAPSLAACLSVWGNVPRK